MFAPLGAQIAVADASIAAFVQGDPIALRLTTAPGVGSMTANAFVATIDDITRFRTAYELEARKFQSRAVEDPSVAEPDALHE